MPKVQLIPARQGIATPLQSEQHIKIVNTHGTQSIDFWVFSIAQPTQHLSTQHTRRSLLKINPEVGDILVSNERKPILTFMENTTKDKIDTLIAACDRWRYEELGFKDWHRNCEDNLVEAMGRVALQPLPFTPGPLNLFMKVPVKKDGNALDYTDPTGKGREGEYVVFRAEMDLMVVMSACPSEIFGTEPTDAHFEVF